MTIMNRIVDLRLCLGRECSSGDEEECQLILRHDGLVKGTHTETRECCKTINACRKCVVRYYATD